MISRSTIFALVFACIATLSLGGVAKVQRAQAVDTAAVPAMPVYQLPRVVVTGRTVAAKATEPAPATGN